MRVDTPHVGAVCVEVDDGKAAVVGADLIYNVTEIAVDELDGALAFEGSVVGRVVPEGE